MGLTDQRVEQAIITPQEAINRSQTVARLALFDANGDPVDLTGAGDPSFTKLPHQAASTASTVAGLVTDFNTLLTSLQTAGLMASS